MSIILQTTDVARQPQIHLNVKFSQNVDSKSMVTISLQLRNSHRMVDQILQ